jgi:xanthine dehydrogenase accessory factor
LTSDYLTLSFWHWTLVEMWIFCMLSRAQSTPLDVRLDTSLELLFERASTDSSPRVLATVVATAGSTYRKSGARMLIMADGSYHGLLSGGCSEADLCYHAATVFETGEARTVRYDMRGPNDLLYGIGAGCEGAMDVFLESAGPGSLAATALAATQRAIRVGRPAALLTVHESTDLPLGTYDAMPSLPSALIAAAGQSVAACESPQVNCDCGNRPTRSLLQFLAPSPHLLICGAGPDARPVASAARVLGWRITIVDHRPAYAFSGRFPGARVLRVDPNTLRSVIDLTSCHATVVMSHHLTSDAAYLRELAEAGAPAYIGLLGPAARRNRLLADLGSTADQLRSRLRGPVGLDIGAVTPEGIALAIISQIHAWLAGRAASDATILSESPMVRPARMTS